MSEPKGHVVDGGYGGGKKFEEDDPELNLDDINIESDIDSEFQALYFYYNYQAHLLAESETSALLCEVLKLFKSPDEKNSVHGLVKQVMED
jgi:hypothetical protein